MDSIFGIGFAELIFIAIIALIILGPERLPGTLREVAKYWGYFRNLSGQLTAQFSEEFKVLGDLNPKKLLNELADEEMAKEAKAKPATPPATPKTTTPAKPTTPTTPAKPTATTPAATTPAKTDASSSLTATAATAVAATSAATVTKDKTPAAEAAASVPSAIVENTILPPKAAENTPAANIAVHTNGATNAAITAEVEPATPTGTNAPAEQSVLPSAAASSANGTTNPVEVAE